MRWEVVQTADTIDPTNAHYNVKSAHGEDGAHVEADGKLAWGGNPSRQSQCAHNNEQMSCIACHSSWNPSCFGCHLPQKANKKMPNLHNEGDVSRNYTSYNFQTLRDDVYMLAHDGDVTGNRIGPARSSLRRACRLVQQQSRLDLRAAANHLGRWAERHRVQHERAAHGSRRPHPVGPYQDKFLPGTTETKMCTDCHVSKNHDNNAIMAQLLMQGTNYVNFIGRYCWVAAGDRGLAAVEVTERDEPQAVIGSVCTRWRSPISSTGTRSTTTFCRSPTSTAARTWATRSSIRSSSRRS